MLKAVKNYHYNKKKKLQDRGIRHLEEYVFDAFMPVFCVLTMEIFKGVIPCVMDEGVRVHGAAHEEFVCEVVDELTDRDYNDSDWVTDNDSVMSDDGESDK